MSVAESSGRLIRAMYSAKIFTGGLGYHRTRRKFSTGWRVRVFGGWAARNFQRFGCGFEPATSAMRAIESLPAAQQGLLVVSEMTTPYGVPDFVAVVGDRS